MFPDLDDPDPPSTTLAMAEQAMRDGTARLRRRRAVLGGLAIAGVVGAVAALAPIVRSATTEQVVANGGDNRASETADLTIVREFAAGPIWEEGSTMVVRVTHRGEVVAEEEVGQNYDTAVAHIALPRGTFDVTVAQRPCLESCRMPERDAETHVCSTEVRIEEAPLELVAMLDDGGCRLVQRE